MTGRAGRSPMNENEQHVPQLRQDVLQVYLQNPKLRITVRRGRCRGPATPCLATLSNQRRTVMSKVAYLWRLEPGQTRTKGRRNKR